MIVTFYSLVPMLMTPFFAFNIFPRTRAFRTAGHSLPIKVQLIPKDEIFQRLGISSCNNYYERKQMKDFHNLLDEYEVLCPLSDVHLGILCTVSSSFPKMHSTYFQNVENIANDHELVSQAIFSGSLAASMKHRKKGSDALYYFPFLITLVTSYAADTISSMLYDELTLNNPAETIGVTGKKISLSLSQRGTNMMFNSGGVETNEILLDLSGDEHDVILYACNTQMDERSATSEVYFIPISHGKSVAKVWRFTIEYKLATINLSQVGSFGLKDSTLPFRPDVWLKDDY